MNHQQTLCSNPSHPAKGHATGTGLARLNYTLSTALIVSMLSIAPAQALPRQAQASTTGQTAQSQNAQTAGTTKKTQSSATQSARTQENNLSDSAQAWLNFVAQVQTISQQSYRTNAQELQLEAQRAMLSSERGDLGLNLSASHTDYPDGLGGDTTSNTSGNRNLDQYSDVRLNFKLLDQMLRKGSRVDAAKARVRRDEFRVGDEQLSAAIELARDAAIAWSEKFQHQALSQAMTAIQSAKEKLQLSAEASMPEITEATLANEAEALILHNEISSAFDGLSPFAPTEPKPPEDYTVLPLSTPGSDDIVRVANRASPAKALELEAKALEEDAESLRANGVNLDLYAGHVFQRRSGISDDQEDGAQYGAVLTIPLGASDYHEARSKKLQAHSKRREAANALLVRQRELIELRNSWSRSVAALSRATERMRQQNRILNRMRQRASQPSSGQAPQPWQVDVERARFWLRVSETWRERGEWLADVMTWAVAEPDYLVSEFRSSNFTREHALCAPLYKC